MAKIHKMESPRKALLIINPISGTLSKEGLRERVEKELRAYGVEVTTELTGYPGAAYDLSIKGIENGCDIIIAAGGDGTFHECATACRESDTALALIPCGSGNGFARHLGIPLNLKKSIDIIKAGHLVGCDYGDVNGHPFFCTMGVGFDATVTHKFAALKRRGRMSYVRTAMQEYLRYRPAEYVISSEGKVLTERALVIAICNVSQYGNNAYIAPKAKTDDGMLDVTIVHRGNHLATAIAGLDMLTGYLDKNTLIHTFRTSHASIEATDGSTLQVQVDGEPLQLTGRLKVDCHHLGLKVLAPSKDMDFKPIITPLRSAMQDLIQSVGGNITGKF